MVEFNAWEKTPRYFRDIVITEKIDGTNAAVVIEEKTFGESANPIPEHVISVVLGDELDESGEPLHEYWVAAQSRKRLITPQSDNAGFARWVNEHRESLVRDLGPGRHFGEWWGQGVQRAYGMMEKVFSLFNTHKWMRADFATPNMTHVPVLYIGPHRESEILDAVDSLREYGSAATEDWNGSTFDRPEGVCIFHTAANRIFKVTLEDDESPKSLAA